MSLFSHKSIKSYLKQYISELPGNGRGEITRMAKHLRVSPTLVSHVLSGEKNFTPEQAQSLLSILGLIGLEADYFTFLVHYERAGTQNLKEYWRAKLEKLKDESLELKNRLPSDQLMTEEKRAIFYSSPIYMMIRLFTSIGDEGKGVNEIAKRFNIQPQMCSEMMSFLVDCGLCIERDGKFVMGAQKIHLEKKSPHLLRFQTDWRMRAINRGENLTEAELMLTAPISLSRKDFEQLREETILFIKRFLDTVHASPAEEIACLNIDFFWV